MLELLQTHGSMSGAELASRLAVERRTLRRYIVRLEEIGIPLFARQLASLPFDFEIRHPPELCEAVAACARRLLAQAAPPLMPLPGPVCGPRDAPNR